MELLTAAFSLSGLPATALLLLVLLYWAGVIAGLQDSDTLDGILEWDGLLAWLGWRGVPTAVGLSVHALLWWTSTMLAWHFFPTKATGTVLWVSLALFPATLMVSRIFVRPFAWLFRQLSGEERGFSRLVTEAVLVTPLKVGTIGQAEIATDGSPLLVHVVLEQGSDLPRGSRVVVVARRQDGVHVVVPSSLPEIP
ncbi:MAG: hypothetical protein H6686_08420 [Fibrobacteria bacterium]|nr:hypothetical protein [Fibrobacteria bacterium]